MRRPAPLPDALSGQAAFGASDARALGASRRRLAASDLRAPFRGARLLADADPSVPNLAAAYARRMPPSHFFSHATAAILNGVPLPLRLESDRRLHVSVLAGHAQPRVRGVIGHQLEPARAGTVITGGLRMTDAATTWCQLASLIGVDDLVAAGDYLLTGRPGSRRSPVATIPMLATAVDLHRGTVGIAKLRAALPMLRRGPLSRRESLLRLRIVRAGLPEPQLNFVVVDPRLGSYAPMVDFAYPEFRIAIEYEGDHHRTPAQFRLDIRRYERLQDIDWIIVRVNGDDVPEVDPDGTGTRETTGRIAARLRQRGWCG